MIDDEESIGHYLSEVLSLEGYECKCFQQSLAALAYLAETAAPPDLVMTDIRMPEVDGLEVLRRVRALSPGLPVILISGVYELATALEAVKSGATDYLFKPAKPAEVLSLVAKHVRPGARPEQAAIEAALAGFLTQCRSGKDHNHAGAPERAPDQALALFQTLGIKRYETLQHSMRVAAYATLLGERYGLSPAQLSDLRLGALLHDIGKVAIPRNVLLKPGPLNEKEWEVMRTHPRVGYQLLAAWPEMEEASRVVYSHHEHYDGAGYPRGLRGEEIPIGARLFSIVDTVDAITCNRSYRPARGFDVARGELRRYRGTQFDPHLVDLFLDLPELQLIEIRDCYLEEEPLSFQGVLPAA
ncbi:MAG TPA: HD domain-containing phosphohydrolase [Bryobacterales bacterium]|nr:HD domain-containing phosphohydrolase [Bryobacterales bacterium]